MALKKLNKRPLQLYWSKRGWYFNHRDQRHYLQDILRINNPWIDEILPDLPDYIHGVEYLGYCLLYVQIIDDEHVNIYQA